MRKIVLALFVLCWLFSFKLNEPVSALSCAPPQAVKEEFANSTAVIRGTALSSNTAKYDWTVTFRVKSLWKGSTDLIEKGIYVSDMWQKIEPGQDYLIFASQREGHLVVNLCGNTKLWSEVSQAQINELGTGEQIPVKNGKLYVFIVFGESKDSRKRKLVQLPQRIVQIDGLAVTLARPYRTIENTCCIKRLW